MWASFGAPYGEVGGSEFPQGILERPAHSTQVQPDLWREVGGGTCLGGRVGVQCGTVALGECAVAFSAGPRMARPPGTCFFRRFLQFCSSVFVGSAKFELQISDLRSQK